MLSFRSSLPHHLRCASCRRCLESARQQRRWAEVHDVRFIVTTRTSFNVMNKYQSKLSAKASAEGHKSVQDLKEAYMEKIQEVKKQGAVNTEIHDPLSSSHPLRPPPPSSPSQVRTSSNETNTNPSWAHPTFSTAHRTIGGQETTDPSPSKIKSLGQIMDLRKVHALPVPEIQAIWRLRYAADPRSLCAVIPTNTYTAMEALAQRCPQFVLPVPRTIGEENGREDEEVEAGYEGEQQQQKGAEIHFLQWIWDKSSRTSTVMFTHLAEFKLRGEYAVPHTTVTHHLDLMDSKGVVLMQGQVQGGKGVSPEDAKWLLMCLQRFYGGWGLWSNTAEDGKVNSGRVERARQRRLLLEWFASGDERFTLERLMEEAENMG